VRREPQLLTRKRGFVSIWRRITSGGGSVRPDREDFRKKEKKRKISRKSYASTNGIKRMKTRIGVSANCALDRDEKASVRNEIGAHSPIPSINIVFTWHPR